MKTIDRSRETDPGTDDIRRITALTVAVRIIFIAHQLKLREQSLTFTRHPKQPVTVDFVERAPFGFAFTAGNEATFRVPSGHRFVIENMHVSCWAKHDQVDVQLVTRSPRMFRQVTCWPEKSPIDDSSAGDGSSARGERIDDEHLSLPAMASGTARPRFLLTPICRYGDTWSLSRTPWAVKFELGDGVSGLPSDVVPGEDQLSGEAAPRFPPWSAAPTPTTRRSI